MAHQTNGVMLSIVTLSNHTFTGQTWSSKQLTSIVHILSPEKYQVYKVWKKKNYIKYVTWKDSRAFKGTQ